MSLSSHPLVKKLEEKLLPEFQEIVDQINQTIPDVSVTIDSSPTGSLTDFQGYSFHIDCLFTKNISSENDNVCLGVGLCHLTTTPKIDAYVCWGHPSGHSEAEFPIYIEGFSNNSLIVTDKILEDLYKNLPRLYEALFEALKRRKPGDE